MTAADRREELEAAWPWSPWYLARARQRQRIDAIEDYLFVGGDRMSARAAAERLGVSVRTVQRYRASLRQCLAGTARRTA